MTAPFDTTVQSIEPGDRNELGWVNFQITKGANHVGALPPSTSEALATIIHTSDWHICDHESPARQEYMDRYFDADSPFQTVLGFIGTYRAHEAFTAHVAAVMIDTFNKIDAGPISGRPVDAVVITGDVTDNGQTNELDMYLDLLDGRKIDPSCGRAQSEWVGAAQDEARDERYWHPEGAAEGPVDLPTRAFGFPTIPGLIDRARLPFDSSGLQHPWLSVHGNHDALLQGVVAPTKELEALAIGGERITGFAPGQSPLDIRHGVPGIGPAKYIHTDQSPRENVTPDPRRTFNKAGEFAKQHLASTSTPAGHGFTQEHADGKIAYFAHQIGDIVMLAMDTVNPHGGFEGSIDDVQLLWLKEQMHRYSGRYVILASHHPARTIINDFTPPGEPRRVLGPEILAVAYESANVIAWINGHEHANELILNVGPQGQLLPEINTASLIDWPQQARVLEFVRDSKTASLYIASTVVNHEGLVEPDLTRLDLQDIAGISRLLAFNDYQRRDPFTSMHRMEGN
ncbi:MAG: TIGR03767 family metallophosphoesterase, partial [Actinomycetes bacterium]